MFRKKGFTLLELIIVIIVIGILASIALPRFVKITEKARLAEAKQMLSEIKNSQLRYFTQYSNFSTCMTVMDITNATGSIPSGRYFNYYLPPSATEYTAVNLEAQNCTVAYANRSGTDRVFANNYNISITANGIFNSSDSFNVTPLL